MIPFYIYIKNWFSKKSHNRFEVVSNYTITIQELFCKINKQQSTARIGTYSIRINNIEIYIS